MRPDIKVWNPENPAQWNKTLAWTTVWLSTFSLTLGFCAWFLVPSLAPRLNEIGSFRRYAAYSVDLLTPDSRYQNSSYTLNGLTVNPVFLLGIRRPAS